MSATLTTLVSFNGFMFAKALQRALSEFSPNTGQSPA